MAISIATFFTEIILKHAARLWWDKHSREAGPGPQDVTESRFSAKIAWKYKEISDQRF